MGGLRLTVALPEGMMSDCRAVNAWSKLSLDPQISTRNPGRGFSSKPRAPLVLADVLGFVRLCQGQPPAGAA